jgi:hypothetical protein
VAFNHTRFCITSLGLAAWLLFGTSCSTDTFLNQTASLGGETAGSVGNIQVAFINNTPFRAIFTCGTYNNTSQFSQPTTRQFIGVPGGIILDGNSVANIVTLPCNRVFSIGDSELLRLIEKNRADADTLNQDALVEGVAFSGAPLGDPDASLATEGFAPPVRALLGVDFPCGAIIVIRFEVADAGVAPFRADLEIIPPREDDRGV